jgi:ERF superfamily
MTEVYKAIGAVSQELSAQGISKARSNAQQGYKFRGIDDVLNALSGALVKAGLVILPRCTEREVVERQTAKGGAIFNVTCRVEFDLVSVVDGSKHTVCTYGEAMDSADKATNKAMSAAYKYLALLVFCIPTEASPETDADFSTHEVKPAPESMAKVIKATDGAGATLSDDRRAELDEMALYMIDCHTAGNDLDAIRLWYAPDTFAENDERVYVWGLLGRTSKLRAAIKSNKPE